MRASSVLPTPEGPRKINEPVGRFGSLMPARARRIDFLQNAAVPAQTDGDCAGYAPLWVSDAPGPIQVVMG